MKRLLDLLYCPLCWVIAAIAIVVLASLPGCAYFKPAKPVEPIKVRVEVPVSCLPDGPPTPPYVMLDKDLAELPDPDLILGLARDRANLLIYRDEAQALLNGCAAVPAEKAP